MGFREKFWATIHTWAPNIFGSYQTGEYAADPTATPPAGTRRSSVLPDESLIGGVSSNMEIKPEFMVEWIDALYHLAAYNGDVSYAIENIVGLGNTKHNIKFSDDIPESRQQEMLKHLKSKEDGWYSHGGGIYSLKNDLLSQAAIAGCISAEIVPKTDISGVDTIVKVKPSSIRFLWDSENSRFIPAQKAPIGTQGTDSSTGLKPLNEITYKYIALRRYSESPYGIPPFLSALESLGIQRDMLNNFSHIMKKMGMLGFISVLMGIPKRLPNETEPEHQKRVENRLAEVVPEIDKTISKGFVVGYKGSHEINLQGISAESQGAKDMFELNEQNLMTGLKQDPAMLGRSFTVTETFGRVILAKLSSQISNYQKIVAKFLEDLYMMELNLAGFDVTMLEVVLDKPMIADQAKEEEAKAKRINNLRTLWSDGIISQTDYARELGYEKPAEDLDLDDFEEDGSSEEDDPSTNTPDNTGGDETDTDEGTTAARRVNINKLSLKYTKGIAEYPYMFKEHPVETGTYAANDGWFDPKLERRLRSYTVESQRNYRRGVATSTNTIASALLKMPASATEQEVIDRVVFLLYKDWGKNFTNRQKAVIEKYVGSIYKEFRKDKSIFQGTSARVPDPTFGARDERTIRHFENSDELYLGRFITDEDTRKKVTNFIKQQYIAGDTPIGNNKKGLADFKRRFKGTLNGEDRKIRRVIETTANKMRNYAAVAYMEQAEVTRFEVRGVNDDRQCPWCKSIQGKTFEVSSAITTINNEVNASVTSVKALKPFLVSGPTPDEVSRMSGQDLQRLGFDAPPYHPHCRDVVIAID